MRPRRSTLSLLALSCALACEGKEPTKGEAEPPPQADAQSPPTLELAGCRDLDGRRCSLRADREATLTAWIDAPTSARLRVTIDKATVAVEPVAVDGGQRLSLPVPAEAERVEIRAVEPPWSAPLSVDLARERFPPLVAEARERYRAGDAEAAIERLRGGLETLTGEARLAALQTLRQLLRHRDPEAALRRTEEAAALAHALGRSRDRADCAAAAVVMSMERGELARAHRWTEVLEAEAAELAEARVWANYYGGALAARTGDLSAAVRSLEAARRGAERLDMFGELLSASEQLATVLAELGRGEEALAVARETVDRAELPDVACKDRARALGNVAWINLLLAEAGLPHDPPRPLLERQLDAVDEGGECPDPFNAARVNLALVALAEHEPEEAWTWLGEIQARPIPAYLRPWVAEIEAQVGVATGRDARVPALVRRPGLGAGEPGLRWSAVLRHARTAEAFGLHEAALASYLEAEELLEQTLHGVGVDAGRELFLAGRQASAEGLVDLLVRRGRVAEGFCRARLARGRELRSIDRAAKIASLDPEQRARRERLLFAFLASRDRLADERREDWKFSAPERAHREARREQRSREALAQLDEALRLVGGSRDAPDCAALPPGRPGELTLMHFPRPEAGAWLFAAAGDELSVRAVASPRPERAEAWAREALEPLADELATAERVRVIPTGAGWSVPFHALPVGEGALLDLAPVVYALDLPGRGPPAANPSARALIVANPSKDLPEAHAEARAVSSTLTEQGWTVDDHQGDAATRSTLTESLAQARLLHYAGHGVHAGPGGWQAALLLHDGDRVGVTDILALPRVPEAVVLSGCDTATVDDHTLAGGMNLGRAFVLAGASWVLAADGKVDDALAREIGTSLYEGVEAGAPFDGAAALRRVQLRLRDAGTEGWAAFRVVVP